MYDAKVRIYLRVDGGFALVPPDGDFLPIADKPSITPATRGDPAGKVLAWGRANTLLIEGIIPSTDSGSDHALATLKPDNGVMNSEDVLYYTVVDVRIVTAAKADPTRVLMVSNGPTTETFTGADPDEFFVEVTDASIPERLHEISDRIVMESMKGVYPGTSFAPQRTLLFPGQNNLNRVEKSAVFRSKPLRLVSDPEDYRNELRFKTLLVDTEIDDEGGGQPTDILGQWIWVSYQPAASANRSITCRAHATVSDIDRITETTDDDPRRVNLELLIFPKKNLSNVEQGRRNDTLRAGAFRWMSRVYAQAGLAPPPLASIPVQATGRRANMVTIGLGGEEGKWEKAAAGVDIAGKPSSIRIKVKSKKDKEVELFVQLSRGDTPEQSASKIVKVASEHGLTCGSGRNPLVMREPIPSIFPSVDVYFDQTKKLNP